MKHKFLSLLAVLAVVTNFSWAGTYYLMQNDHSTQGTAVMQCPESSSPYTATWECTATGTYYFYMNNGSKDFLNGNQTFSDGVAVQLYEYGTSDYSHSITLNATSKGVYSFSYNSSDKKLICTFPKDPDAPVSGNLLAVLKGEKVMFYGGEQTSWNQEIFNVYPENGGSAVSSGIMSGSYKFGSSSTTYEFAALCAAPNTNYQWGHWESGLKRQATAGCAMIVRGSTTNDELEQKAQSGSNYLYKVTRTCTTTVTTTVASTATLGGTLSYQITTSAGKSVLNKDNSFKTYLYDGTNYKEVTPSDNAIDISALTAGSGYKVVTVLYDGAIYVVGKTDEFSVQAAAGNHSITYPTATKWTYGDDKPTQAKENDPVSFTATPNAGYTLAVSSEQATINKDGNTYSFTMPDKDVTIKITATAQEFGITYPATPSNYTLDGSNPVMGTTDAEISFTATPDDGYQLSVTSEQVASFTKNGNTYSFTMPAKAVTINIVASEVPITRILLTSSYDADVYAYSWDRDEDFKQITTSEEILNKSSGVHLPMTKVASITKGGQARYVWEIKYYGYSKIILKKGTTDWNNKITGNQENLVAGKTYFFSVATTGSSTTADEYADVTATVTGTTVDQNDEVDLSELLTIGGSFATVGVDFTTIYTINSQVVSNPWTPTEAGAVTLMTHVTAAGNWTGMTAPSASSTGATITVNADTRYRVTFTSTDGGAATAKIGETAITSGDKFDKGSSQTIEFKATPNDGYKFYGWYTSEGCNGTLVSEDATFTETVDAAYSIKAVFVLQTCSLKHPWVNNDWQYKELPYVTCDNQFYCYHTMINAGFNYMDGSQEKYIQPSDITKIGDPAVDDWVKIIFNASAKTITIEKVTTTYAISAIAESTEGTTKVDGTAETANIYEGKVATLTVEPKDGYSFVGWYDNAEKSGEAISTDASYTTDAVFATASYYAKFEAETQYEVTVANNVNSDISVISVGANARQVTANPIEGYKFTGWVLTGDISSEDETANPILITATGSGTLTANYSQKGALYFRNTLGWDKVYAYLFKSNPYREKDGGYTIDVKNNDKKQEAGQMTLLESDIYKYEYAVDEPTVYVAFSSKDMTNYNDFSGGNACFRGDFNTCRPVFVPDASQTKDTQNGTDYYNSGYWQTNDTHTGMYFEYTDHWTSAADQEFIRENTATTRGMMSVYLEEGTYEFKVYSSCSDTYYGNDGTITDNIYLSDDGWTFENGKKNCQITATKEGDYTFYFDFVSHKLWVLYPTYYLKHKWQDGEHSWSWKNCDIYNSEDHTYSLYATYEGTGVNYNTKIADVGDQNYCTVENGKLILVGDPQEGKPARFTFNPETEKVIIENMYFSVQMNKYGYATLYHKENLQIPEGVTAKYVTGTSGVLLTYQEIESGVIPKETGVMLFAPSNMLMEFIGVAEAEEEAPTNIMDGSHDAATVDNSDIHYILTLNDNNQIGMFWPYDTNEGVGPFTNAANKAYIYVPGTTEQTAPVRARGGYLLSNEVNTPTEQVDVTANVNVNGKVLRNGQLIIIRDGIQYNALGEIVK